MATDEFKKALARFKAAVDREFAFIFAELRKQDSKEKIQQDNLQAISRRQRRSKW